MALIGQRWVVGCRQGNDQAVQRRRGGRVDAKRQARSPRAARRAGARPIILLPAADQIANEIEAANRYNESSIATALSERMRAASLYSSAVSELALPSSPRLYTPWMIAADRNML